MARPLVLNGHIKKKCIAMKLDSCVQIIITILGSMVDTIGRTYVITKRDNKLFFSIINSLFAFYVKWWNLKWQYPLFSIATWMRQFFLQCNIPNCLQSSLCMLYLYSSRVKHKSIFYIIVGSCFLWIQRCNITQHFVHVHWAFGM